MFKKLSQLAALLAVFQYIQVVHGNIACGIEFSETKDICQFDWKNQKECGEAMKNLMKQFACKTSHEEDECYMELKDCDKTLVTSATIKDHCTNMNGTVRQFGVSEGKCIITQKEGQVPF